MIEEIKGRVRAVFAPTEGASPLFLVAKDGLESDLAEAPDAARAWAAAIGFSGAAGRFAFAPDAEGAPAIGLFGLGDGAATAQIGAAPGAAEPLGPRGWRLAGGEVDAERAALEWGLGAYRFERYAAAKRAPAKLAAEPSARTTAMLEGVYLARDLVNTPASDLGPEALEAATRAVAETHGATLRVVAGADLLDENYPMIHAVGRAAEDDPRLLDLRWGAEDAPKVTLVGKGVCFDTGGLDIKPARAMRLMKKDMGGAAAALGLAHMLMAVGAPIRLRVLIPAVENSISDESFRPGDVLRSRKGLTVEVGDTDAEGRLVLADALVDADAEAPELLVDFATLTGAARVALGPELPPFYTDDDALADEIAAAAAAADDPVWRMPLWPGYAADLSSKVADLSSISNTGFAGSIIAALFLKSFVSPGRAWAHFDIFAWNPKTRPGRPEGGEAHAARALFHLIEARYSAG